MYSHFESAKGSYNIDIMSPGGLALCATWVREDMCKWVHIRCPASVFPVQRRGHAMPEPPSAATLRVFIQQVSH